MSATAVHAIVPPAAASAAGVATAGIASGLAQCTVPRLAPQPPRTALTLPSLPSEDWGRKDDEGVDSDGAPSERAPAATRSFFWVRPAGSKTEEWWEKEGPRNVVEMEVASVADFEVAVKEAARWCAGRYASLPPASTARGAGALTLDCKAGATACWPYDVESGVSASVQCSRSGGVVAPMESYSAPYMVVGDLRAATASATSIQRHLHPETAAPASPMSTSSSLVAGKGISSALPRTQLEAAWYLVPGVAAIAPHPSPTNPGLPCGPPSPGVAGAPTSPLVVVKFYASWCRACRGVQPPVSLTSAKLCCTF